MSLLQSMSSGVSGAASNSTQPVQTTAIDTDTNKNTLDVSEEVANITGQNSLAMRAAAATGQRTAASRGLQNSTIGAESAQRAMLDAALPMAQQNVAQRQETKQLEDSARANTVGEYLNTVNELTQGFMDAYKDIQASEIPVDQKTAAINDLVAKRDQQLSSIKSLYQNLTTTQADWASFPDLI